MNVHALLQGTAVTGSSPSRDVRRTGLLLLCGAAAGPIFTAVVLVQVLTRDGFDLSHQPLSLLSLGVLGLSQWQGQEDVGVRLFLAAAVGFAWTTFVALDLRTPLARR